MAVSHVLLLNRSFCALRIIDWKRALVLLYLDRAVAVDQDCRIYSFTDWKGLSDMMKESPSGFVHTPSFRLAIPEVIALKVFDRLPTHKVAFTRRNVYEHYRHRCCYCGRNLPPSELNLDHVIPRSRGGQTDWTNVVTSCVECNHRKGDRPPEEAGMRLLIKPSKPRWHVPPAVYLRSPVRVRASWQKFIDQAYWDTELEN